MSEDWAFHLLGSIPQMAHLYSETDEGTLVPLLCHFLPLSLSEKFFLSWPSKVTDRAHFAIELWPFSTISVLHVTQIFLHYALILSILTKPPHPESVAPGKVLMLDWLLQQQLKSPLMAQCYCSKQRFLSSVSYLSILNLSLRLPHLLLLPLGKKVFTSLLKRMLISNVLLCSFITV